MRLKYIVACSLMLVFCVLTKMFGYSYSSTISKADVPNLKALRSIVETDAISHLEFANELLPSGDKGIEKKMRKALKAHSYNNLRTLRLHQRAEIWFPIIEPILKKYGVPEDFKYIPLVETGMTRGLYSPKGAAGVWQFMPETARDYGLTVNGKVDERMNVRLATVAAARYIKDLYKQFNSWTLAAAAYNGGEGRMRRQIAKQQQDDYFRLKLNQETGKYVYSLISMKEVIEHPEDYGYKISNPKRLLAYEDSNK
ncbi:murein transglycosylase [Pelobium manganitolerans]|uniref:Murein transglycosylase n=1 Tax=Pelobium manganitolerans TaxID=1842495 RepID=A0A419S578_9SPHI|nr:lytic transglycosylase domain-containing protein [Pelobium manganitolerans]RKD15272.1 murein transglycosylase [Pelobium manganitolerans]